MKAFCSVLLFVASFIHVAHSQSPSSCQLNDTKKWNYHVLKVFTTNNPSEKVEYSFVLRKNTTYSIRICEPNGDEIKDINIKVLDAKRNQIATNEKVKKKNAFQFTSTTSGICYLQYYLEKPQEKLVTSLNLGMKSGG